VQKTLQSSLTAMRESSQSASNCLKALFVLESQP
jgi:hypothetical protein